MKTKYENEITKAHRNAEAVKVFSHCDHCGFAIYEAADAYIVRVNGDRIHRDCFSEYIEEHMFDFVEKADDDEGFDCGF